MTLLEIRGMTKRYGGVKALRGADLTIDRPGEVHALFGENGSGKSTLLGILAGIVRPDAGTISLEGSEFHSQSASVAHGRGISMVSQETALAQDLTVGENVLMGRELVRQHGRIDWRQSHARAQAILDSLGQDISARTVVRRLLPDQQQVVEIARAVSRETKILILDEPTSSLTEDQTEALFRTVRRLSALGVAILFVSHRIPEVRSICDSFTCLRDGESVGKGELENIGSAQLIAMLTGTTKHPTASAREFTAVPEGASIGLRLAGVQVFADSQPISLNLTKGTVTGFAGMTGSGRSELLAGVFGGRKLAGGEIELGGTRMRPADPRVSITSQVGYLPPDRKSDGLVQSLGTHENLVIPANVGKKPWAVPRRRHERPKVLDAMKAMRVKAASTRTPVNQLSGGNQQKVALGKWLVSGARVLLLDEPTRGVDIVAKFEIHERIKALAESGVTVLVSSSENDELMQLCDVVHVMYRGNLVASRAASQLSEATIAHFVSGGE